MNLKKLASDANLQWLVLVLEHNKNDDFEELMLDLKKGSKIVETISECYAIKAFMDEFLLNAQSFTKWSTTAINYFKSRCETTYYDAMKINRNSSEEGYLIFPNSKKDWKHRLFVIKKIKNFWLKQFLAS